MESSPDRENSQGTTESRVADDSVHKHGTQEVSSAEGAAAAASSVSEPLGRVSGSERLEAYRHGMHTLARALLTCMQEYQT